jgi:hypothetical protein
MDVEVNEPGDILDGSNDYSEVLDTVVADDPNVQYLIQMANGGNLLTGMSPNQFDLAYLPSIT